MNSNILHMQLLSETSFGWEEKCFSTFLGERKIVHHLYRHQVLILEFLYKWKSRSCYLFYWIDDEKISMHIIGRKGHWGASQSKAKKKNKMKRSQKERKKQRLTLILSSRLLVMKTLVNKLGRKFILILWIMTMSIVSVSTNRWHLHNSRKRLLRYWLYCNFSGSGNGQNDKTTHISLIELSYQNSELRLLELFYYKIYKIFPPSERIENINDQY